MKTSVAPTPVGNNAPTISNINNITTNEDTATSAIQFIISDPETAAGSLTLSGASSNTTLIPNANIVFGGSGASRTVTVTPASNQSGTATITVTVSDGTLTASDTFVVTVNAVNDAPPNPATLSGAYKIDYNDFSYATLDEIGLQVAKTDNYDYYVEVYKNDNTQLITGSAILPQSYFAAAVPDGTLVVVKIALYGVNKLSHSTYYHLRVFSHRDGERSVDYSLIQFKTPPPAPTNLIKSSLSVINGVYTQTITWTKPTSGSITSYSIYRIIDNVENFIASVLATATGTTQSYTINNVTLGSQVIIKARDSDNVPDGQQDSNIFSEPSNSIILG